MNSKIFYTNPEISPQIYHRTPCPTVLICKGVLKKQRRGRIISNFTKGKTFHLL